MLDVLEKNLLLLAKYDPALKSLTLTLQNDLKVSFKDIIALAGDFYGVPNLPISESGAQDRENRFNAAYVTLAERKDALDEVPQIIKILDEQKAGADAKEASGSSRAEYYDTGRWKFFGLFTWQDVELNSATGHFWSGRYEDLAVQNFDHFNKGARIAHEIGHRKAIEEAKKAADLIAKPNSSSAEIAQKLNKALSLEAYADHFLTDGFSAGHVRVPREALFQSCLKAGGVHLMSPAKRSGIAAYEQHEEDGKNGLNVTGIINNAPASWHTVGDGALLDNTKNAKVTLAAVQEAVLAGLLEVIDTALAGNKDLTPSKQLRQPNIKNYYPDEAKNNPLPLFKVISKRFGEDYVARRDQDPDENLSYSYSPIKW